MLSPTLHTPTSLHSLCQTSLCLESESQEAQTIRITRSLCDVATYGLLEGFHLSLPPK